MHKLQTAFSSIIKTGLERKSANSPSKWAQLYRVMNTGPWSYDQHPWLKDMHNSTAHYNVGKKAAQMGFTETVLNLTFYRLDMLGQDCLYVLPTAQPAASNFSSSRVDAAVALSPHLTDLFSKIKNSQHKKAGNADLFIRGCRSRTDLKSDPISFLVFDELDEMNEELVTLGELRCSGQKDYQIWKISTPTVANKKIDLEYQHSTQEHFMFKCPSCNKITELVFPDSLVMVGNHHRDPDCDKSYYQCTECKKPLPQNAKSDWLGKGGFWNSFATSETRGFHISQLYSFVRTPGDIARAWLEGQIKQSAEQEFYNSRLGLPFVAEGTQVSAANILDATGDYQSGPQPGLITMGVDIGRRSHHYVIAKWEIDKLGPEINGFAKQTILKIGKANSFAELDELMRTYQVLMAVLDSQPEYQKTLEFCLTFQPHAKMCTYNTHRTATALLKIPDPSNPNVTANRTLWLETAISRLINGTTTLPKDYPEEFETNIKNLLKRYGTDRLGNETSWYENNGPDHFAHALGYAEIALPLAAAHKTSRNIEAFL